MERGLWNREKLGGVKEIKTEGGVSGESHVSVKASISIDLSRMKFWRSSGLSRSEVIVDADRMFRVEKEMVKGLEGPGLSWISPESSREK